MKTKILLSSLLSFSFYLLSSQVPQGFNYQAIARDSKGNPITNATVKIKLSILTDTTGFYASGGGTYLWEEEQTNVKTNAFGLITLIFGDPSATKVQGTATSFSAIDWAKGPLYIGTKIANPTDYKNLGSAKLWTVPYSMVADSTKALLKGSKLSIVSSNDVTTDALFEVKRKDGQTVFAVYPNAVNVYVPRTTPKGLKGGFAIGGFDGTKITPQDYFRVTPDSVRIYIDKTPNIPKGTTKGGFAIGGFDQTKNTNPQDLLTVSNDSIRMYINDLSSKGATKGGFAIGGFDQGKASSKFMNVSTDASGVINPSQNRVLWYPIKNAFLAGRVLIEKPDSVGENSFATGYESKANGQYSQALGYKAIARGDYSTAVGKNAVANKNNSFAFGDSAKASNFESYAIGRGAFAGGYRSFAFGSAGVDSSGKATSVTRALGDYSFALGQGAQALGIGSFAIGLADTAGGGYGHAMGSLTHAMGWYSTAMGFGSGAYGVVATSIGFGCYAPGFSSTSMGYFGQAISDYSISIGYWTWATGNSSLALGYRTTAGGNNSTAMGYYTKAPSYCETAIGSYNTNYTVGSTNSWNTFDRLFVIGNGTSSSAPSNAVTVLKNGCIGLQSVTSPTYALQLPNNSNAAVGSGRAYAWTTYSDSRLKENQMPISYGLKELMELSPMQYIHHGSIDQSTWSKENISKTIGLVAQEVYKVIPEAVDVPENNSTGLWGLNYDKLIPVLVKAIQEQQNQIESYKSDINTLQEKVEKIESQQKQIDELKALVNTLVANQASPGNK